MLLLFFLGGGEEVSKGGWDCWRGKGKGMVTSDETTSS